MRDPSPDLLELIASLGIQVKGLIRHADGGGADHSARAEQTPQLSVRDYQGQADAACPVLLCCESGSTNVPLSLFREAAGFVSADTPVLHPASLAPLDGKPARHGLFALMGAPGSGNRVTQRILTHVLKTQVRPWDGFTRHERFLQQMTGRHLRLFEDYFSDLFDAQPGLRVRTTRGKTQLLHNLRIVLPDNNFVFIYGLNGYGYFGNIFTGHVSPSHERLAFLTNQNYNIFYVVRHPLDVIVSVANKIVRPPELKLDDLDWFERQVRGLGDTLRTAADNAERMHVVRYEDLIGTPYETIARMAEAFGVTLSQQDIESVWGQYGFKSVTPAGDHLWRPGSGKYREFLRPEHAAVLEKAGLRDAARSFGYDFDPTEFTDRPEMTYEDLVARGENVEASDRFFGTIDASCSYTRAIPGTPLSIRASTEELAETAAQGLNDPLFRRINDSVLYPDMEPAPGELQRRPA